MSLLLLFLVCLWVVVVWGFGLLLIVLVDSMGVYILTCVDLAVLMF